MNFSEFKKYKHIVESRSSLQSFPEAEKIHRWMEETGRLDEKSGFWGSIWGWIKKNFSSKGISLHKLADEYEKELIEETRAEYDTLAAPTIASKIRKSSYSKLSRDIEERMNIVAEDDEDYRELARELVNQKDIKVKKMMLNLYASKLDPSEVSSIRSYFDKEEEAAKGKVDKLTSKLSKPIQELIKDNADFLKRKIGENKAFYAQILITSGDQSLELGKNLAIYLTKLSSSDKRIKLDNKTILSYSREFVESVLEISKKLVSKHISKEDAIKAVKSAVYEVILEEKPVSFDKVKNLAFSIAKKSLEKDDVDDDVKDDVKDEVVTDHTSAIVPEPVVDFAIKDASTGKKHPTAEDIIEEIKDGASKTFTSNVPTYVRSINNIVEKFNNKDDVARKRLVGKYHYEVDANDNLSKATDVVVKALIKDFVKIVGVIVPYYIAHPDKKHDPKEAKTAVVQFMFEIYAVKKDPKGELYKKDIEKIIENIKMKEKL